ncbi:MAG TPA: Holliday junction resolvase RuvX [Candidatus Cryosericum sp.]|nr:Holliday junction resolvase RuvX [Candidatus Cryosericum sp.]
MADSLSQAILCLDVGERHIGLARAVPGIGTALAAGAIDATVPSEAVQSVVDRIQQEHAGVLVVGLPLALDGTDSVQTRRVRRFVGLVRKELAARGLKRTVRVELVDERLSSVGVQRASASQGLSEAKGRATKDQWEAVWILQGYLDRAQRTNDEH